MAFSAYSAAAMGDAVSKHTEKYSLEAQDQRALQRKQAKLQVQAAEQSLMQNKAKFEEWEGDAGNRARQTELALDSAELSNDAAQKQINLLQSQNEEMQRKVVYDDTARLAYAYAKGDYAEAMNIEKQIRKHNPTLAKIWDDSGFIATELLDVGSQAHQDLISNYYNFENPEQLQEYLKNPNINKKFVVRNYRGEDGTLKKELHHNLGVLMSIGGAPYSAETFAKIQKDIDEANAAKGVTALQPFHKMTADQQIAFTMTQEELGYDVPVTDPRFIPLYGKNLKDHISNKDYSPSGVGKVNYENLQKAIKDVNNIKIENEDGETVDGSIDTIRYSDLPKDKQVNIEKNALAYLRDNPQIEQSVIPANEVKQSKDLMDILAGLTNVDTAFKQGSGGAADTLYSRLMSYFKDTLTQNDIDTIEVEKLGNAFGKLFADSKSNSAIEAATEKTFINLNKQTKFIAHAIMSQTKKLKTVLESHRKATDGVFYYKYDESYNALDKKLDKYIERFRKIADVIQPVELTAEQTQETTIPTKQAEDILNRSFGGL